MAFPQPTQLHSPQFSLNRDWSRWPVETVGVAQLWYFSVSLREVPGSGLHHIFSLPSCTQVTIMYSVSVLAKPQSSKKSPAWHRGCVAQCVCFLDKYPCGCTSHKPQWLTYSSVSLWIFLGKSIFLHLKILVPCWRWSRLLPCPPSC